jgi:hypothetical protein
VVRGPRPRHGTNPDRFAREGFIEGVEGGFVEFDYAGWHQELVDERITPEDVRWAGELLARLTPEQWDDAFRAGGHEPAVRQRFISTLLAKVEAARTLGMP